MGTLKTRVPEAKSPLLSNAGSGIRSRSAVRSPQQAARRSCSAYPVRRRRPWVSDEARRGLARLRSVPSTASRPALEHRRPLPRQSRWYDYACCRVFQASGEVRADRLRHASGVVSVCEGPLCAGSGSDEKVPPTRCHLQGATELDSGLAAPVQSRSCPLTTSAYGQGSSTARPAAVGSVDAWPDES